MSSVYAGKIESPLQTTSFSDHAIKIMRDGNVLSLDETPEQMVDRLVSFFDKIDSTYFPQSLQRRTYIQNLKEDLLTQRIVPSTPVLTNAGRFDRPLSACSVPPVSLRAEYAKIREVVDSYHRDGMGTGFDLTEVDDPCHMARYLNGIAVEGLEDGSNLRPVGNMGVLHSSHPKIREFVDLKRKKDSRWAFNLSVNADESFMFAAIDGKEYRLSDGREVDAAQLLREMAEAAWECGCPGLLFLDRLNAKNPLAETMSSVSVAPCAEVGLAKGETCQFAYVNVANFLRNDRPNFAEMAQTVKTAVRMLDDAVEHNIDSFQYAASSDAARYGRKIGVGVCGFSKMLAKMQVPYDSEEARVLSDNILSWVNYQSKRASMELAQERGSFGGFNESAYVKHPAFLTEKFGKQATTAVYSEAWAALDKEIKENGLRNATTMVLPPTGRSALMFDTSQQLEPIFSLVRGDGYDPELLDHLADRYETKAFGNALLSVARTGSIQGCNYLGEDTRRIFLTATEISPVGHLRILRSMQRWSDESVSKTVNLPSTATVDDVLNVYLDAFREGAAGITIYRDGSRTDQPVRLGGKANA